MRIKLICLLVVLMLAMVGTAGAKIEIEAYNGSWQTLDEKEFAGQPYPEYRYTTQKIELPINTTKVRLTQSGTDTAHLDEALLNGTAPINVTDSTNTKVVPAKLEEADYDVIDAAARTIEISWTDPGTSLVLTAVEENVFGVPLLWPKQGYLEYTLDGSETFSQYFIPASSHPASTYHATFSTTSKDLVVYLDATGDNTLDPGEDWAELRINTTDGIKKFRISDTMTTWGTSTFEYTDMVTWEHKTYQFNIPLEQIGKSQRDKVQFQISYYGTVTVGNIYLTPESDTNIVGTDHTVTATVKDENGVDPLVGRKVTFEVISGPNAGENGTNRTDSNGEATFTYTGDPIIGTDDTDEIRASFGEEGTIFSNTVTKTWTSQQNENPAIDIEKYTNGENADSEPGPEIAIGDPVVWTYVITNTGDVPLYSIILTDDKESATFILAGLAPGSNWTGAITGSAVAGQYANVGTVEAYDAAGGRLTDSDPSHYLGVEDVEIPEFPTIALPIIAVIGLAFFFQRRND